MKRRDSMPSICRGGKERLHAGLGGKCLKCTKPSSYTSAATAKGK